MLETGTIVGGYRVDGLLGEGGMGTVYRATQLSLDRVVALKVLTGEVSHDPAFRERFRREGQRQAGVEHPHIVSVYEAGETDAGLFLAMRLVEGPTLKALLLARQIGHRRSLKVLTEVADALDAAHAVGLVHRDVKPQNILIGPGDHAYLADFGLTKGSDDDALLTEPGHFVGTIDYISPEQARGEAATAKSDVYSLCCVLVECMTSEVPFPRPSEPSVLFAHLTVPPPTVSDRYPDLPAALDAVIARGMAKEPDQRYASAGALLLEARRAFAAVTPGGSPSQRTRMRRIDPDVLAAAAPPPPSAPPDGAGRTADVPAAAPPPPSAPPDGAGRTADVPAAAPPVATPPAAAPPAPAPAAPAAETVDRPPPPPPPPEVAPATGRRPWAGLVAALVLVAAAAAAGALAGRPGSTAPAAAFANSASAGPLELSFPAGWQRRASPPQTPGLGLANPLVLAPARPGDARLEAGTTAASGPALLPAALLALLAARPAAGQPVRIGGLQALRYAGLAPRGLLGALTLYVIPTSQGVLALACRGGPAPPAGFAGDCARVVATARVVGARAYPIGPSPAFAAALRSAVSALAAARRPAEARLAGAATAAGQAVADRELAGAYARAARQVAASAGGDPQVSGAAAQLGAALTAVARAYQRSAAAAAALDPAAYAAAGRDLARAGKAAAGAGAALRALGYRVSG